MSQNQTNIPSAQQPKAINTKDPAILATWRRFLDYDQVSSDLKRSYSRLREIVIVLGLLTSAGAVFSIYLRQVDVALLWLPFANVTKAFGFSSEVLRILLIIMPIASVILLRYASQFASSTSWIEYRVGAETLRSEIYLYRMKAGIYKHLDPIAAKSKLLDAIDEANTRIDEQGATVPYMRNYDNIEQLINTKTETPGKDNGINPLAVHEYIEWRVRPQLSWYIQKIQRDYSTLRREQILALTVGGFGAVLSGLGQNLEAMVAVTTAMGIALTARSETRMYGATYGIFHWTAGKLQHELNQWEVLREEDKQDEEKQLEFVAAIEKIFTQERELWRAQAMQSQNNSDNTIHNQLQQRVDREDLEAHKAAGIVPAGIPDDEVADDLVKFSTTQSMRMPPEIREAVEQKKLADAATNGTAPADAVEVTANGAIPHDLIDDAATDVIAVDEAADDMALLQETGTESEESSDKPAG